MRILAVLVFLLFCVYALTARWYFVCKVRNNCDDRQEDIRLQTLSLKEGEQVIYDGFDQMAFDSAVARPNLNENNVAFLDTVDAYLKKNTTKKLLNSSQT